MRSYFFCRVSISWQSAGRSNQLELHGLAQRAARQHARVLPNHDLYFRPPPPSHSPTLPRQINDPDGTPPTPARGLGLGPPARSIRPLRTHHCTSSRYRYCFPLQTTCSRRPPRASPPPSAKSYLLLADDDDDNDDDDDDDDNDDNDDDDKGV
jgi:hypothetical protein